MPTAGLVDPRRRRLRGQRGVEPFGQFTSGVLERGGHGVGDLGSGKDIALHRIGCAFLVTAPLVGGLACMDRHVTMPVDDCDLPARLARKRVFFEKTVQYLLGSQPFFQQLQCAGSIPDVHAGLGRDRPDIGLSPGHNGAH